MTGSFGADTEARAAAGANGDRGVMRASASAGFSEGGNASAAAIVSITETYTVSGTGTLTARLKLDGSWFVLPVNGGPFQVQASTCVACNSGSAVRDVLALDIFDGASGAISGIVLSASQAFDTVFGPAQVQVGWELLTQIGAPGRVDFGSTGRLLLETTGTLVAVPEDSRFLSDPAFFEDDVPAVPLPPTFALLLAAVGLGGAVGRKRAGTRLPVS